MAPPCAAVVQDPANPTPPMSLLLRHERLTPVVAAHFPWARWESFVAESGVTLDRPRGSRHPRFPDIVYPLDYGYVNGTDDGQGEQVDVFVGTAPKLGLVGMVLTRDHRRGDREVKLLLSTGPAEVYLAVGFLNFDRTLLDGTLALRYRMSELWEASSSLSLRG